jgi:arsenate reductase (glutaredoxin)
MEVQVFGVKKSAETRKALRFFSERRVRAHFVDLTERELADGELQRFVQKFGVEEMIERESKRFAELGLHHTSLTPARWADKLLAEPLLLRMPLVRRLGQPPAVTVGSAEETWKSWLSPSQ